MGVHFLTQGIDKNEKALFITFAEQKEQILANAQSLGFDLADINFLDLSPTTEFFEEVETYDIFSSAEVEREPVTEEIKEAVNKIKPKRIFIDSITQFRYLTSNEFQFHKQCLAFLRFLTAQECTVLLGSESSQTKPDDDLQFLSDGIIQLKYENEQRSLEVTKFRGSGFRSGVNSMKITEEGIKLFPILKLEPSHKKFTYKKMPFGIPGIDQLLKGGVESNTSTVITGPSGTGKTTLGMQLMKEAAGRGEGSIVYQFDENKSTLIQRCNSIQIPISEMLKKGSLKIRQIEPLLYTPEEFAHVVRQDVEKMDAKIVMIDSLQGYQTGLGKGTDLIKKIHALSKYLSGVGVSTLITNEVANITGNFQATDIGISYMADTILFLKYLEIEGEMRKAIGILKDRLSDFERTLREFEITKYGIKVGEPLIGLRGILKGTPEFVKNNKDEE